ncbi:carboxymuconolactone decarboxylase family protein [Paracoccus methylarcula]|uniref:Carboxymuconolactone decarboxylase family protein n=2 Tax=Paracoccus methylarcula TaxID=72022 RepID=A0A422R2A8_9RHOB|nr:carboxymuconolactone decarboxylase family protein [Paracoccus methylarcula]
MEPTTLEQASGEVKELLSGAKAKLGFVPNMYGYMANLPGILAGYLGSYQAFREATGFTPAEQETIFLTISRINGCNYCMAAHSMIADKKSGVPADSLTALREGGQLPDARLNAVARFTEAMVDSRGNPGKQAVDDFLAAGYGQQQVLGVVLAIACKTFSNYVNHLAGTPVDEIFAAYKVD